MTASEQEKVLWETLAKLEEQEEHQKASLQDVIVFKRRITSLINIWGGSALPRPENWIDHFTNLYGEVDSDACLVTTELDTLIIIVAFTQEEAWKLSANNAGEYSKGNRLILEFSGP